MAIQIPEQSQLSFSAPQKWEGFITPLIKKHSLPSSRIQNHKKESEMKHKNKIEWPVNLVVGSLLVLPFFFVAIFSMRSRKTETMRSNFMILESGQLTTGIIKKAYFMRGAPTGWAIDFTYEVNGRFYSGKAYGPKKIFGKKKSGEEVEVIYARERPSINRELEFFVNYPGNKAFAFQNGFEKEFSKFMNHTEYTNYSLHEWISQQQTP